MKETGFTRTLDETGRLVIPKELRRTLGAHEGQQFDFLVDTNLNIVLKLHKDETSKEVTETDIKNSLRQYIQQEFDKGRKAEPYLILMSLLNNDGFSNLNETELESLCISTCQKYRKDHNENK